MVKIKVGTFPQELSMNEADYFSIFKPFNDSSSYEVDYNKAVKYAKRVKAEVYTMVDGENNETVYLKGKHFVNRFGFCVLGWSMK